MIGGEQGAEQQDKVLGGGVFSPIDFDTTLVEQRGDKRSE